MKVSKKIIPSAIAAALMVSFIACSGSSSGGATTYPNFAYDADGTGVDGYISGATVCLDLTLDGSCDATKEPTAKTDSQGDFSLSITPTHQAHANYASAPVILFGGKDIDTQKDFIGTMKTSLGNAGEDMVISPLTTMVRALVDNNSTQAEAEKAVATAFGLDLADVLKDPVAAFKAGDKDLAKVTLTLQKSMEILATANGGKDTTTLYSQLASSVLKVAENNATTGMPEIISQAKSSSSLTGEAALVRTETISTIETAIKTATAATLQEQAVIIDAQTDTIKENPKAVIDANTIDASNFNAKKILITNYLNQLDATTQQKTTALALSAIVSLIADTSKTTADITDKILGDIFKEDSSLDALSGQLTDIQAPVITLAGTSTVTISKGTVYTESGATAVDNIDKNVKVVISGSVDNTTVGSYTLTYTATDAASNKSTKTRTVIVVKEVIADIIPPVITLNGESSISLAFGASYTEAGATATDNIDGSITVVTTGNVDTSTAATYTVTYTATDDAGNESTASRTVIVAKKVATATPTTNAELLAAKSGSACVDKNGATGTVSQTQDPFGNVSSATCTVASTPTPTPTPTSETDLLGASEGSTCVDKNGATGTVSQTQDPFGNVSSATCTVASTPTPTPTPTSETDLLGASEGSACVDKNGATGTVSQTQDPFGNVSSATCAAK